MSLDQFKKEKRKDKLYELRLINCIQSANLRHRPMFRVSII